MFDATTSALLRSAPAMPGLNPVNIPALLTAQYANLAAARLRGGDENLGDLLLLDNAQLRDIEVMTPERCLAMLSFAPEAFQDVGLLCR